MMLASVLLLGAFAAAQPATPPLSPAHSPPHPVEHVIHISVDGLRGDLLHDLLAKDDAGDYAGFQRFVDEGATTFNARTDFTHTITLPNHTCMLTGRPVLAPPAGATPHPELAGHGYVDNGLPAPGVTLHTSNPNVPYIASVFDVAHDHGLTTALYSSKDKFVLFDRSWDASHGAPDTVGEDNGADKIDQCVLVSAGDPGTAAPMNAAFLKDMAAEHFSYAFVHYRDTDSAGHKFGWGSQQYLDAAKHVAGYLTDVFALVENDPALAGSTIILLSADHGGTGPSHGDPALPADYTIPFFAWGAGVPAGADLYDLNLATRKDPGTGRPRYDEPIQPIRNGGGGNLALSLLGLGPIPGSMINVKQDLRVTGSENAEADAVETRENGATDPATNATPDGQHAK